MRLEAIIIGIVLWAHEIIASTLVLQIVMAPNQELPLVLSTANISTSTLAYTSVLGGFTIDIKQNYLPQSIPLMVDLNFGDIFVPLQSQTSQGIDCSAYTNCSCSAYTGKQCEYSLFNYSNQCLECYTYMALPPTYEGANGLPSLNFGGVDSTTWPLSTTGLWGMGQFSTFWKYLSAAYKIVRYMQISLIYNETDGTLTLNGRKLATSQVLISPIPTPGQCWSFPQNRATFYSKDPDKGRHFNYIMAIDNTLESYFGMTAPEPYQTIVSGILSDLCGNALVCYQNNSDLSKVSAVSVRFHGDNSTDPNSPGLVEILVPASSLISFDPITKKAILSITPNSSRCLSSPVNITLGRPILTLAELSIRFTPPNTFQLAIASTVVPVYPSVLGALLFLLYLACLLSLFIIICICLLKRYSKNRLENSADCEYRDHTAG